MRVGRTPNLSRTSLGCQSAYRPALQYRTILSSNRFARMPIPIGKRKDNDMALDLSNLTMAELDKLVADVNLEIKNRESKKKKIVLEQIRQLAESAGITIEEIAVPGRKARRKFVKRPGTTYVNPDNPKQTWTGKGRRPTWVKELLATGKALEEVLAS